MSLRVAETTVPANHHFQAVETLTTSSVTVELVKNISSNRRDRPAIAAIRHGNRVDEIVWSYNIAPEDG